MSKISFFVGIPDGMLDDFLSRINAKLLGGDTYTKIYIINGLKVVFYSVRTTVSLAGKTSVASTGKWDVYVVSSGENDWKTAAKIYRHLKRFALGPNSRVNGKWRILGPLSAKQLQANHPAAFTALMNNGEMPFVVSGDDARRLALLDYSPSDADCTNDVEIDDGFGE